MSTSVNELVKQLELLGERMQESANAAEKFHLEISYYLDQASFSCWETAQNLKEATYLLGS